MAHGKYSDVDNVWCQPIAQTHSACVVLQCNCVRVNLELHEDDPSVHEELHDRSNSASSEL